MPKKTRRELAGERADLAQSQRAARGRPKSPKPGDEGYALHLQRLQLFDAEARESLKHAPEMGTPAIELLHAAAWGERAQLALSFKQYANAVVKRAEIRKAAGDHDGYVAALRELNEAQRAHAGIMKRLSELILNANKTYLDHELDRLDAGELVITMPDMRAEYAQIKAEYEKVGFSADSSPAPNALH